VAQFNDPDVPLQAVNPGGPDIQSILLNAQKLQALKTENQYSPLMSEQALIQARTNNQYAPLLKAQELTSAETANKYTPLMSEQALASATTANQSALAAVQGQKTQLQNSLIADAARKALADPDNADSYFESASKNGAPAASQYIGRYNPFLMNRVIEAYGNTEPAPDLSVGSGASPLAAAQPKATAAQAESGVAPSPTALLDRQYQNYTPEQMATTLNHYNAAQNALISVMRSPNPEQEWNNQLATLKANGVPVPPTIKSYSPLLVQQLYQNVSQMQGYLQQRVTSQSLGGPAPLIPRNLIKTDAGVIEVDPYAPTGTPGKLLAATPNFVRTNAVDAQGRPILADSRTGQTIATQPGESQPTGTPVADWAAKMQAIENPTGNRAAANPASTATGNGQFIDSTWLKTVRESRPELKDLSDTQLLELRKDPAFSAEMTVQNARSNADYLAKNGQPVNGTTLALAHRFGPSGAETVLNASPDTKMSDILPPAVIKANPALANQTAGQYTQSLSQQMGVDPVDAGQRATARTLSPEEKALQEKQLPAQFEKAKDSYESAQSLMLQLRQMQDQLGELGTAGFLAPGSGDTRRLAFAKTMNSLATSYLGIDANDTKKLPFNPNKVASGEDIAKGTTRLGFDLARQLGSREALMVVQQAIGAVPGIENTPRGAKLIFGSLNAAAQRQSDYYEYLQRWAGTHTNTLGADVAFNKAFPVEHYANQALVSGVPADRIQYLRANPKAAKDFDAYYGKGLSGVVLGSH
jgi:hypothetical protein